MRRLALLPLLLVLPAGANAAPNLRTLAVSSTPIRALAQDDGRVAWFSWTHSRRCNGRVFVLSGRSVTALPAAPASTCRWPVEQFPVRLALSGRRAVWSLIAAGNITEQYVFTSSLTAPRERELATLYHDTDSAGEWLTALAGDAPAAVYAVVRTRYTDESGSTLQIGGAVRRLSGGTLPVAAAKLALDGFLAATAEATGVDRRGMPIAGPGARIEAWDLRSGSLGWVIAPGTVRALEFAYPFVVAFLTVDGERKLWVFNITNGTSAMSAVPRDASGLSTDGSVTIVFRTGQTIYAIGPGDAPRRVVARAHATPIGLSLEGTRVVWAENIRGRGYVRAVSLD